ELERYLRAAEVAGLMVPNPVWSIRALSDRDVRAMLANDAKHPWRGRPLLPRAEYGLLPVSARMVYNSAFPFDGEAGGHDGPVWAGRGATTSLTFGGYFKAGPLTVQLAPVLFRAGNA